MTDFDPQRRVIEGLRHKLTSARATIRIIDSERAVLNQRCARLELEVARLRIAVLALSDKDQDSLVDRLGIDHC